MRVNALGSLYYFTKNTLRRKRLVDHLHRTWCQSLERDHLKHLFEYPRDHFKSTICSESYPIWRALPFNTQDEDYFRVLGYNDEFIAFMHRMHRRDSRNLLVAENITNAAKLGTRISGHYESNAIFRVLFPEILPDSSCTWSNYSLCHKRTPGAASHGEGTFDFLGVGGALQSRHYNGLLVQDDLIGRKAIESISIMEKSIEYHQLLVGAFENPESSTHENDEFIVGNRWSYTDLNSHIREHEPWFKIVFHGAMGGCCPDHPADTPIFPEEFSTEKLDRWRKRLGTYHFSCQFLNNPAAPENADFKEEWLNHFSIEDPSEHNGFKTMIRHEVKDGQVLKDFPREHLRVGMTVDPNHSGNQGMGRCRHSINVVGESADGNYYHLDCWAKAAGYDEFYNEILERMAKWKLTKVGLETIAAQKYIGHYLTKLAQFRGQRVQIVELKGEVEGPDGELTRKKEWRIRNVLSPIFESGRFYTQRKFQDFLGEYTTFPKGRFVDILDGLAYMPQLIKTPQRYEHYVQSLLANQRGAQKINQPYSVGVN
jgi:phage terminase large subunit-like protein